MKGFYSKKPLGIKGKNLVAAMSIAMMSLSPLAEAASSLDCSGMNHPAYQSEYQACLRLQIAGAAGEAGVDCVDCLFKQEKQSNPWVDALGIVAQPLAFLGATYLGAKYQYKSQQAWAMLSSKVTFNVLIDLTHI